MNNLEDYFRKQDVSIFKIADSKNIKYINEPPFNPSYNYPEYFFNYKHISKEENHAYNAVRENFRMLRMDEVNFGTKYWNPLKDVIKPGYNVLIKPNFVLSKHSEGGDLFSIITHPSVIRAVIDYVYIALSGKGKIIIADSPQMDCNFNMLLERTKLYSIQELYIKFKKLNIDIIDLRDFWLNIDKNGSFIKNRVSLPGDLKGSKIINLGTKSELYEIKNWRKFYGADYDRNETILHHHVEVQEYMISQTVLDTDVIISIPKLKVHKKVGVTLNAKGLVGISTNKNYLVHYRLGSPDEGGDEFPNKIMSTREEFIIKIKRLLFDMLLSRKSSFFESIYFYIYGMYKKYLKGIIGDVSKQKAIMDCGNWFGNDTAWRMVVDLVKIIFYADHEGILRMKPQRKIFSLIDGIIGGEGEGPLLPNRKESGVIIAGYNPIAVDLVASRLMGFDWRKIPIYKSLVESKSYNFFVEPEMIEIYSNFYNGKFKNFENKYSLNFNLPEGWKGRI